MAKESKKTETVKVTTANAGKVENEKTKAQEKEAAALREKMKKADQAADEAREEEARRKTEYEAEKKRLEEERKQLEEEKKRRAEERKAEAEKAAKEAEAKKAEAQALAASTSAALIAAVKKGGSSGFWKGALMGLIAGVLITVLVGRYIVTSTVSNSLNDTLSNLSDDLELPNHVGEMLDNYFTGFSEIDFEEALLAAPEGHQELIVMEQPVQIATTITKAGLANLPFFKKSKTITYYGTGVYTVDLKRVDEERIEVDTEEKTVTVKVPHARLQYVEPDYDKIEIEDTEKGFLTFTDLSLTVEQQNEIEKAVMADMEDYLLQDELLAQADEFAVMKTWDTYQPLVTTVSPEYKLMVEFDDGGLIG